MSIYRLQGASVTWIHFLQDLVDVDDDNTLLVRCGRCGRRARVALMRLVGLRTFDCDRCRRTADANDHSTAFVESGEEINALLAQTVENLSDIQRSMLIRKVAGFSDRELSEIYGLSAAELDGLVMRLAERLRSLHGSLD